MTKFKVDPDKGAATAIDNQGQAIATILYETADPCGLNVRWAESSVPGTATPLLKKIVQVEEPDFIRMTPTTWSGAGWVRKLVREHKQGRLPLVVWDFYGDQYEVTWTDGRKPSEDKLNKFINSTDPDIRRNPQQDVRESWWVLPSGQVIEAEPHNHVGKVYEQPESFGLSAKDVEDHLLSNILEKALRKGAIRLMLDLDEHGRLGWGAEIDTSSKTVPVLRWRERLYAALQGLGVRSGTKVEVFDYSSYTTADYRQNPRIRRNPEGWKLYVKRGYCDICKSEPVEVFEHPGWPHACAVCIPKWEAHVKRSAAEDELWSKYLQFRRESGRETYFGDMARHDRAKAEFLEAFKGGKGYVLKKAFEEWLNKPKQNPAREYVEVTIQTLTGKRRSWAEVIRRGKLVIYRCLDREGSRTGEMFVAKPGEAVEKRAKMSLKYGTFEIAENPARAYTDKFFPSGGS